jgi:hypothetical protein
MGKLKTAYYDSLKTHFSSRKYKEQITVDCSLRCLRSFKEDDLNRNEMTCLVNCYNKYYRYLAYSNSLYTYLLKPESKEEGSYVEEDEEDGSLAS